MQIYSVVSFVSQARSSMNMILQGFSSRTACPLCTSLDVTDMSNFSGIRVASCQTCGFWFSRDIKDATEIDRFYVEGYQDQRHMDGQRVNATVNADLIRSFLPRLSGKSVLDIGSGFGFLLDRLKVERATRLAGVELSEAQRRYSIDTLKLETFSRMEALAVSDQFDVIVLFEVIEHIPEPLDLLSAACKHLKDGGSLIVGTDNFSSRIVKILGQGFPKWIPHEHVSFFTPRSLTSALARSGPLQVVGTRSYTSWELLLRQMIFQWTGGRRGGAHYEYRADGDEADRTYRYFTLRYALNKLWFTLSQKRDLEGEMMYIHAIKSPSQ